MCVFSLFGIEGGMWGVIVSIPDHCLSIYFVLNILCATKNYPKEQQQKDPSSLQYKLNQNNFGSPFLFVLLCLSLSNLQR